MPSIPFIVNLDPSEMASRFQAPEPYDEAEDDSTEEAFGLSSQEFELKVLPLMDKIPPREADYIELYYRLHKAQKDIAEIFGLTQAAISYSLNRGVTRLKYLLSKPQLTSDDIRTVLTGKFSPTNIEIMVLMAETTCQSLTAENLRLNQGRVRHRFILCTNKLRRLAEQDPKYSEVARLFTTMVDKKLYNILHTIELPQWKREVSDVLY